MTMTRMMSALMLTLVVLAMAACGSDGVSRAEYDLVVSELSVANRELALAQEQLTVASEQLAGAEQTAAAAVADERSAEAELDELQDEMDGLFTIDADEQAVMERQQSLGVLGTLFVEFRDGPWDEQTVQMFSEFVSSTGEPEIIDQLDVFAAAVAADPESDQANYEYGILGYSIMSALEREVVDPFGR